MRKLSFTLAAIALALASMLSAAGAQSQRAGATSLLAQIRNATPIIQAACRGERAGCPPGSYRACNPYHCWCRPC